MINLTKLLQSGVSGLKGFKDALRPNAIVPSSTAFLLVMLWAGSLLVFWFSATTFKWVSPVVPTIPGVLHALTTLWSNGVVYHVGVSLVATVTALMWATAISIGFAYLAVVPVVRPLVAGLTKLRFLGLPGIILLFTALASGGDQLRILILTFGMTVFYVTEMSKVILELPKENFNHARTLGMSELRVTWEVVVLGTMDRAFEALRTNAAIGWMMLATVEGVSRSGGGIGVLLLNSNRSFNLEAVLAIQLLVFSVGIGQDMLIGFIKNQVCPYANLGKARTS